MIPSNRLHFRTPLLIDSVDAAPGVYLEPAVLWSINFSIRLPRLSARDHWQSASSELGVSGTVQVNAPDSDLTTNLEILSQDYLDAVELRNRCAEGPDESQFRVASRILQGTPDGMLRSFALASFPRIGAACQ